MLGKPDLSPPRTQTRPPRPSNSPTTLKEASRVAGYAWGATASNFARSTILPISMVTVGMNRIPQHAIDSSRHGWSTGVVSIEIQPSSRSCELLHPAYNDHLLTPSISYYCQLVTEYKICSFPNCTGVPMVKNFKTVRLRTCSLTYFGLTIALAVKLTRRAPIVCRLQCVPGR